MSELELMRYYLAQERSELKHLSVDEHGAFPLFGHEIEHQQIKERIDTLELMIQMRGK